MPAQAVSEHVRSEVRALQSRVGSETAEAVALAMVSGAAQGFRDIKGHEDHDVVRRLLAAVSLDIESVAGAMAD